MISTSRKFFQQNATRGSFWNNLTQRIIVVVGVEGKSHDATYLLWMFASIDLSCVLTSVWWNFNLWQNPCFMLNNPCTCLCMLRFPQLRLRILINLLVYLVFLRMKQYLISNKFYPFFTITIVAKIRKNVRAIFCLLNEFMQTPVDKQNTYTLYFNSK